ncbi:MAG: tetratricopeptide repeat protein [Pirellulaceae bacterium]
MSTPLPTGSQMDAPITAVPVARDAPPPRRNWLVWLVFVVLIGGGLVWLVVEEGPREIARWREASAWNAYYAGDFEQANKLLDEAIAWDPERVDLYLIKAEWLMEQGELNEALAAADHAIELDKGEVKSYGERINYAVRSEVYVQLGQPEEAVEDWETIALEKGIGGNPQILNAKAYARAVGNIELEKALGGANMAVEVLGNDQVNADRAGVFLYRAGRPASAAQMFNRTIDEFAARYEQVKQQQAAAQEVEPFLGELLDASVFERRAENATAAYARAIAYRGQAYQAAGDDERAKADLEQAEELGADLEATKARLEDYVPDDMQELINQVSMLAAFLDTRGFCHHRLGDDQAALRDLEVAVELIESFYKFVRSLPGEQDGRALLPADERKHVVQLENKQIAVIRYHRGLAHEGLGNEELAKRDFDRVRELGFEPSPQLH